MDTTLHDNPAMGLSVSEREKAALEVLGALPHWYLENKEHIRNKRNEAAEAAENLVKEMHNFLQSRK